MFDKASVPAIPVRPQRRRAGAARHSSREIPWLALTLAVVASGILVAASPIAAKAADPDQPSLQYQDQLAHAGKHYNFKAGGIVTVPYRPRPGDSTNVDGGLPVALPAATGSTAGLTQPGTAQVSPNTVTPTTGYLRREVFGFLPYWSLGTSLNYDALSTIAYFGVAMNSDGSLCKTSGCVNGWNGWMSGSLSDVINNAHSHGARVVFTIESMAWTTDGVAAQTALLSSPTARAAGIANIVKEVTTRGVDGVNLDFEPIASGQSANYVAFVRGLRAALDAVHPGYEITFCANGSGGSYDLGGLLAGGGADAVFIMAYDLRGGNAVAGSIDPTVSNNNRYTLTSVTNYFLTHGAAASQVILGLPWEGRAWSVGPAAPVVNATAASTSVYGQGAVGVSFQTAKTLASQDPATTACSAGWPVPCVIGWQYDPVEETGWTAYYGTFAVSASINGAPTWRELYFDDPRSLAAKCDAIDGWNLRGVGIWELGLDSDSGDLANVLVSKFLGVPATYTPVTPTRLADTRIGLGISTNLVNAIPRSFQVAGAAGGLIPTGATAVTGNLTVTGQQAAGFLYLGPVATSTPTTSTLNFPFGDNRANGVTASLSSDGKLWVTYVSPVRGVGTQAIFDVTGYYMPGFAGSSFKAVTPTRLLDTRIGTGLSDPFHPDVPRTLQVVGAAGGLIPADAVAITGNLTVTGQTAAGWLYVGPDPVAKPESSTLNFPFGDIRANNVTVKLGSQASNRGTISITYASVGQGQGTQVVFDVTGYYTADTTGAAYVPVPPSRLLDTRIGDGLSGTFSSRKPRALQIVGRGGVPSIATAITGNLTVTNQSSLGWLYLGPAAVANPGSSNLNFPVGDIRANGLATLMSGGTVGITYAAPGSGTTQVVFDVTGYFVPIVAG